MLSGTTFATGKVAGCGINGNIPCYNTANVRLLNVQLLDRRNERR